MKKIIFIIPVIIIMSLCAFSKESPVLFLRTLGYETSSFCEKKYFTIPKEFNMVYNNYNEIQIDCGFDLSPYRGKRCIMYTWEIYNHPFGECRANVIMYHGEIIGGDISSVNLQGFMTGLI